MKDAIISREATDWEDGKRAFIQKYKFTIAFENSSFPGYTTEKLYDSLFVGSIPIYWGNPMIDKEISSEAIINCNDFDDDFDAVIEKVIEIDRDDERYMYMLSKSPVKEKIDVGMKNIESFLSRVADGSFPA